MKVDVFADDFILLARPSRDNFRFQRLLRLALLGSDQNILPTRRWRQANIPRQPSISLRFITPQASSIAKHPPQPIFRPLDILKKRCFGINLTDPTDDGADFKMRVYLAGDLGDVIVFFEDIYECPEVELGVCGFLLCYGCGFGASLVADVRVRFGGVGERPY